MNFMCTRRFCYLYNLHFRLLSRGSASVACKYRLNLNTPVKWCTHVVAKGGCHSRAGSHSSIPSFFSNVFVCYFCECEFASTVVVVAVVASLISQLVALFLQFFSPSVSLCL